MLFNMALDNELVYNIRTVLCRILSFPQLEGVTLNQAQHNAQDVIKFIMWNISPSIGRRPDVGSQKFGHPLSPQRYSLWSKSQFYHLGKKDPKNSERKGK